MGRLIRLVSVGAVAATAFGLVAQPAFANGDDDHERDAKPAVFVPTNDPAGNQIVAYARASDGNLTFAASYSTGGQGGALNGAAVDKLASQGALTYDARHHLLFTVNAGSNTVSVFKTNGTHLSLRQVISSGGSFPVSVAVHGSRRSPAPSGPYP